MADPIVLINTVGLTCRHLPLAPRLSALAEAGWYRPLREVLPAVTCTAQASMLTGEPPQAHGIVGNGWLYRETMEVRFWQQSNRLLHARPVYQAARDHARLKNRPFRCAKIFWWFNQGAAVDISITPKPFYAADGNKAFDILTTPADLGEKIKARIGDFPFQTFWGPMAGLPCTKWIARCAAEILKEAPIPDLTLIYLPHLDYEPQRVGPDKCDWKRLVGELDKACIPILDAAKAAGARVWVTNEYTHVPVDQPILINRALAQAGLLTVRPGPFGDQLDVFASRAFAVCDHQLAHVYIRDLEDAETVWKLLETLDGVDKVYAGPQRAEIGLEHYRAGEFVALAKPRAWFAYPFWSDDARAPDYARTVDIHRKPGYDPCELFIDPAIRRPKLRLMRRLLAKKMGFRTLFDVIPLDPRLVKGSHGLSVENLEDRPVFIGDGGQPPPCEMSQMFVHNLILEGLGLLT